MKIKDIADYIKGRLQGDGETEIKRITSLETAGTGDLSFLEKAELIEAAEKTKASCLLVPVGTDADFPCSVIGVNNPKLAFARIAAILNPPKKRPPEIHPTAVIADNARIAEDVFIGAFCCVGERSEIGRGTQIRAGAKVGDEVRIGSGCILHPNVFIDDRCELGDRVVLHSGVVVGTDGFGYVRDEQEKRHIKFPQIGRVIIANDVEIGANSCVDRGALGDTRIGEGTKIDNQVQVAHNVNIGKRVIIAAQTGISGSVTIEDDCVIAGQVGFADHTRIEKGSVIGAKSAVFPGKIVRTGVWSGIPVMPLDEYKKLNAYFRSLPRLAEELKVLKEKYKNSE
jgi:UDP-3-O-[3-hydroxymyristoyl] glucosamine N-acyltransferase